MTKYKKGFTLLEILLVITLVGVLASIVLVAINPIKQLAEARNAQRLDDITKINQALEDYFVANKTYPTGITTSYQNICPPSGGSSCIDLSILIPDYLISIPIAPNASAGTTGYTLAINPSNEQISLRALNSELGVTIVINAITPTITFARSGGGASDDTGNKIDTFSDGSSIVIGGFSGTAIFGQGEPNQTTLVSTGSEDMSIIKYNANGSLAWAKQAGGTGTDRANNLKSYPDGSSIIIGYFSGTATFGQGEVNQTSLVSAGLSDIFIARYNANGTLAQVRRFGGTGNDSAIGIDTFLDGSIVITGAFENTVTFGQGEPNQTTLVSAGQYDIFTAKYNADNTLSWVKGTGGIGWGEIGYSVVSYADGSSIVTGNFNGDVTFGQGEPSQTLLTLTVPGSFGNRVDIFIAKYNANGSLAWAKKAGGVEEEYAMDIDKFSDGSFVITGGFRGVSTFGPGDPNQTVLTGTFPQDMFIAKYNVNGTLVWAKRAGSFQNLEDIGYGVITYSDGSSIVTGKFAPSTIFGEGEVNETEVSTNLPGGSSGIFVAKYNDAGNLIWVKATSNSAGLLYNGASGFGIAGFRDGSFVITGIFVETTPFGQDDANVTTLTAVSPKDMFIAKYNTDGRLE